MRTIKLAVLTATLFGCERTEERSGAKSAPEREAAPQKAPVDATERIVLDAAYARQHGYELPAHIEFEVPAANLHRQSPPAEQRVFLRLDRTTADGGPVEDLMITSLTIPPGDDAQRLAFAKGVVESQGLAQAMPADGRVIEVRELEIAGVPAILGIGEFEARNSGKVYTSMVALILPEPACFSIMAHHVAASSEVKGPEDVAQKGLLAAALSSMSIEP